jgi:hypothetical protein
MERWREEVALAQALQAQLDQLPPATPPTAAPLAPARPSPPAPGAAQRLSAGRGQEDGSSEEEDPDIRAALRQLGFDEGGGGRRSAVPAAAGASSEVKEALEREILNRKRAALACKKEGNMAGAKEAMKEVKLLEQKLAEVEERADQTVNAASQPHQGAAVSAGSRQPGGARAAEGGADGVEHEPEVTSEDEHDPEILAALREMGWQEDHRAGAGRGPGGGARDETAKGAQPRLSREESVRVAGERLGELVGVVEDIAAQKQVRAVPERRRKMCRRSCSSCSRRTPEHGEDKLLLQSRC